MQPVFSPPKQRHTPTIACHKSARILNITHGESSLFSSDEGGVSRSLLAGRTQITEPWDCVPLLYLLTPYHVGTQCSSSRGTLRCHGSRLPCDVETAASPSALICYRPITASYVVRHTSPRLCFDPKSSPGSAVHATR